MIGAERRVAEAGRPGAPDSAQPLLQADHLVKSFALRRDPLGRVVERIRAVDGVDLTVEHGATLGIVGESGSGKTTVGRIVARLINPDEGTIRLAGVDVTPVRGRPLKALRRRLQVIFQNPYAALDPTKTVGHAIAEPLLVHRVARRAEIGPRVAQLLERVALDPSLASRYPVALSGGQRQRVCIARALALSPDVLVADEPTSALDLSTRSEILNLLLAVQEQTRQAIVVISHDFATVRHLAQRLAVMYLGRVVEEGPASVVATSPLHPYTQALLSAVPLPDPVEQRRRSRIVLQGDIPSPADPPSGCRFRTRCPVVMDECSRVDPSLRIVADGHRVACLRHSPPAAAGAPAH